MSSQKAHLLIYTASRPFTRRTTTTTTTRSFGTTASSNLLLSSRSPWQSNHRTTFKANAVAVNVSRRSYSIAAATTTTTSTSTPLSQAPNNPESSSSSSAKNMSYCGIVEHESDPQAMFLKLGMLEKELYETAAQRPTPLRLVDMYKYATIVADKDQRLRNAQFLHRELPIRVAQRAVDLLTLPHGLSAAIPIRQVACAYIAKLHCLLSKPMPLNFEEEEQFTDLLQSLVQDSNSIPMAIARGLAAWRDDHASEALEPIRLQEMEDALYRFFMARVGLRLLTMHHVLSSQRECARALRSVTCLFANDDNQQQQQPGLIHSNVDLVFEISRLAELVMEQTKDFYGYSPDIEVVDCIDKRNTGDFTYVLNHLHYMMEQLLKNSCRAVIRQHHFENDNQNLGSLSLVAAKRSKLPPIRVVIVKGDEDVTIKVADKGGGIPRSKMATIWKFAHSTADETESTSAFGTDNLSGFRERGFGLPLTRIYARYLGGELTLKSMEGFGLDAYLHLPRLCVACENLPRLVRFSPGERDSLPTTLGTIATRKFSSSTTLAPIRKQKEHTTTTVAPILKQEKHATATTTLDPNNQNNNNNNHRNYTADRLMEELRHCITQEAKNQRIWAYLHATSRAW